MNRQEVCAPRALPVTLRASVLAMTLAAWLSVPSAGAATPSPAWRLSLTSQPTNFTPGSVHFNRLPQYSFVATNVGGAPTSGPIAIADTLPTGVTPVETVVTTEGKSPEPTCEITGQAVSCTAAGPVDPGRFVQISIVVDVSALPDPSTLVDEVTISGGGAPTASVSATTNVTSVPAPFGLLPGGEGMGALLTELDGSTEARSGSHPYQFTVDLTPTTEKFGNVIIGTAGGIRDVETDLPQGLVVDPTATPVRCTQAQLASGDAATEGCPRESQVGTVSILTSVSSPIVEQSSLYNMVPPPGAPASLGFDALGLGVYVHIVGGVRSDDDYGITATTSDVLARSLNPILGVEVQLWGDPSSPIHDATRGLCSKNPNLLSSECAVSPQPTALVTLPSGCAQSLPMEAGVDSWLDPGSFLRYAQPFSELDGSELDVDGCDQLAFEPSIESSPTTNATDSPTGLDFNLHQVQDQALGQLSPARLKDATVILPPGMSVNPSQADGLGACTVGQIGFEPATGHFTKQPDSCPGAAKLGTVEVTTPLLAQYDDENELLRDGEGDPVLQPLHGSVYLAKPFENPFGSLIAIYLSIDDARTGIVTKLAGKVIPNPDTGQLTTRFEQNPELPLEDVRLRLFSGPRGPLITPQTCGVHTTESDLTPWSAPEGNADAGPLDDFETTVSVAGGRCPTTDGEAPNAPAFDAGTLSPRAGAYSPLLFRLSREDGSQRIAKIDATLPPGLTGKLAGIPYCSEAQIEAARSRARPNAGGLERDQPSCPRASEVGVVTVAAGAGPTPFHVSGNAYLAGPYKGAPLSLAIVTPAIAGPFDLGAVVVRTALYVEPESAQIHAVSDPLPTILEGIPLDVRTVAIGMARPDFTLNPTSCAPMAVAGVATSVLGVGASLSSRFQVGGCSSLRFKPSFRIRLFGIRHRGGHPRLRAVFKARPGDANTSRIVLVMPHSEFIDQSHFKTICTRVQFAARQCPPDSVYGRIKARSPLLDHPLEGPVYLRSSSHELPDVVAALRGPPEQPIEIDLVGRVDSVNGRLRTTFEEVPDAPVGEAVVTMRGGKKGLFQNSTNICRGTHRATLKLDGQNGKVHDFRPKLQVACGKKGKKQRGET